MPQPSAECGLRLTEALLAVLSLLLAAQRFAARRNMQAGGLLAWPTLHSPGAGLQWLSRRTRVDRLFDYPGVLALLALQLLSATALLTAVVLDKSAVIPLLALLAATLLFRIRQPLASDGAQQFGTMALLACGAAECMRTPFARQAVLVFLAVQGSLAYGTAGFLKLFHRDWWSGRSVLYILAGQECCTPGLARLCQRHPRFAELSGIVLVLLECLLCLAAFAPPEFCVALLGLGFLMHLGIARVLGYNTFLWSFPASYPATYFVSCWLHRGYS